MEDLTAPLKTIRSLFFPFNLKHSALQGFIHMLCLI